MADEIRIVAVGFGPHPGAASNPGQEIVETLAAEDVRLPGAQLLPFVAPSLWWDGVHRVDALVRAVRPQAVLVFGFAAGAPCLQVGRTCLNAAGSAVDANNFSWPGPRIAPGEPERRAMRVDAHALAGALNRAGAPATAAPDAGDFVENRCLFGLLSRPAPAIVAHVGAPMPSETARRLGLSGPAPLNRAQLMAGAVAALEALCHAARRAPAPPAEPSPPAP